MKTLTLPRIAVAAAVAGSAAFAGDEPNQTRLALERARVRASERATTTVAVYADRQGVSTRDTTMQGQPQETRFELRKDSHGQTYGVWVAVNH